VSTAFGQESGGKAGGFVDTLLGPEITHARCSLLSGVVVFQPDHSSLHRHSLECAGGGHGVGAGRCLRTTQWMRASYLCGQVVKGARWMPWHQEPMKDVGDRDSPRGAVNRAVIRGCPNGETRQQSCAVTRT
jgi:hypothetical protein